MRTCVYYLTIEQMSLRKGGAQRVLDTGSSVPAWEVDIAIESRPAGARLALFVGESGVPTYARLTLPSLDVERDEIPSSLLPFIQAVKEHLLTVLHLSFKSVPLRFGLPIWSFMDDGAAHSIGFDLQYTDEVFDAESVRRNFVSAFAEREALRLLADGGNDLVPLPYRFLSLFKLMELQYRPNGRWDYAALDAALDRFADRFERGALVGKPRNIAFAVRDACAHIYVSSGAIGVTHLNHAEAVRAEKCLPILSTLGAEILNARSNGNFQVWTGEAPSASEHAGTGLEPSGEG